MSPAGRQRLVPELLEEEWESWISDPDARLTCPADGCGRTSEAYWDGVNEVLRWPQCRHRAFFPEYPNAVAAARNSREAGEDEPMTARPSLITDHWFRAGPVNPDGTDGYWICDYQGCGQHRGDHLQVEGHWLKPLHPFVSLVNYRPSYCRTCGRHRWHTTHTPWTWEQLETTA